VTSDPPDTPAPSPANHLSLVRAALVLAGFLVAVGVLVAVGTRPSVSGNAIATVTTTTTAHSHKTVPTTTTTTVAHGSVTVVVANGTSTNGLAGHYTAALDADGWNMQTATDATTETIATSAVYYAAGQQEPAAAIAASLGLKPSQVLPLTTSVPVSGVSSDDVVVVVGADLVAGARSS
jgi:hypothetical protein